VFCVSDSARLWAVQRLLIVLLFGAPLGSGAIVDHRRKCGTGLSPAVDERRATSVVASVAIYERSRRERTTSAAFDSTTAPGGIRRPQGIRLLLPPASCGRCPTSGQTPLDDRRPIKPSPASRGLLERFRASG
jgi:hypothetical protein